MALQIRRGLEANRSAVTPDEGEFLYTTDQSKLYVGNGTTAGGVLITGSGIGNVIEDTTPQLGGALDVNGHKIVSSSNGNIELDPNGTGNIILHGNLTIDTNGNITKTGGLNISPTFLTAFGNNDTSVDGNVYITRNSYSTGTAAGFTFAQHHNTADAVNFTFYRSRGTGGSQTVISNGDDIVDLAFVGHDGTSTPIGAGNISCQVDGTVSTGIIPGRFRFALHDGVTSGALGLRAVAELNSAGVWKVNSIQNYSGTALTVTATTVNIAGDVQINARGDLRFADEDSSNYVAFQAPATVASNITWTLPAVDGSSGQVLSTNGLGTLSWATASGGSGLSSRTDKIGSTTSIANGATGNIIITGFKGYILYKIQTSHAAWVRLYSSVQARTDDSARLEGTDPLPGSGVIAEVITTGSQTILISPGVLGFNSELVTTTEIPCAITNKSGSSTIISVTLTVLQIEV
jgi:hypothetical protein